jgi:hypothetical protein
VSGDHDLSPDDEVRFVGPSGSAHHWPGDEIGVVSHVWNGTRHRGVGTNELIAAWPTEWIRQT